MHSNIWLGVGLFIARSALASPCKPRSSASDALTTTTFAATEPTSTSVSTTTDISSKTTSTITVETTVATSDASETIGIGSITTATSEAESTTISQAETTTTSDHESTTAAPDSSETTTIGGTTTATSEAESTTTADTTTTTEGTTTAAVAAPTFSILAGSAPVTGAVLQAQTQQPSYPAFNPSFNSMSAPYSARTWILDPNTGHVKDKATGSHLCAYYLFVNQNGGAPSISTCVYDQNPGLNSMYGYLSCQIANGQLSCTAPKTVCNEVDGNLDCITAPGQENAYNQIVARESRTSNAYLAIYETTPNGWSTMALNVQEV
ncbi:hypothetical protein F53441_1295 [Fusarium austroafricanum]|uniref:Uncharacterized protein n=1 Tax=Fusarium austroafricanum TaxID=2364996 RepID=A0A8H4KST8_9HYPO|nr:hypothetical protein F53441_1295 [Fusarium austroafricanum]